VLGLRRRRGDGEKGVCVVILGGSGSSGSSGRSIGMAYQENERRSTADSVRLGFEFFTKRERESVRQELI
jgi:hypothetical protein